jgi:hypothetical protein
MQCGKSVCSLIQRLNHGMSDALVRAVTSGCYEIETSVRAMHVAGFDQVTTSAQVVNVATSDPRPCCLPPPKENPAV